jgi:hypothetical protein
LRFLPVRQGVQSAERQQKGHVSTPPFVLFLSVMKRQGKVETSSDAIMTHSNVADLQSRRRRLPFKKRYHTGAINKFGGQQPRARMHLI